jgi:hypothetical protein
MRAAIVPSLASARLVDRMEAKYLGYAATMFDRLPAVTDRSLMKSVSPDDAASRYRD